MPCFLTQTVRVDLTKVDPAFVNEALKGVVTSYGESVHYANGKLTITARNKERTKEIENQIKRGISENVLKAASKKFRWQLKNGAKQDEYVVEKRGF